MDAGLIAIIILAVIVSIAAFMQMRGMLSTPKNKKVRY